MKDGFLLYTGGQLLRLRGSDVYYLTTAKGTFKIKGPGGELKELVKKFDGKTRAEDLLPPSAEEKQETIRMIELLKNTGLFVELPEKIKGEEGETPYLVSYLSRFTEEPLKKLANFREKSILVLGKDSFARDLLAILKEQGFANVIRVETVVEMTDHVGGGQCDCFLIAVDTSETGNLLAKVNELSLEYGFQWVPVVLGYFRINIGPWVYPKQTACYHCFRLRHASLLTGKELKTALLKSSPEVELVMAGESSYYLPASIKYMAAAVVTYRLLQMCAEISNETPWGRLYSIDLTNLEISSEIVRKLPFCPMCAPRKPPVKRWREED